jgi:zinc/manganese transport system substrate-binding protein
MKRWFSLFAIAVFVFAAKASDKPLTVITTIPDLADMAREIGGAHVNAESMAHGTEDVHAVSVRPSLAAKLGRADVLIEVGLEMEHAYLPALLDAANNPKLRRENAGLITASAGIIPKEIPTVVSRTEGEQHPAGNPHLNVGPASGRVFAQNIARRLAEIDPQHAADYKANLDKYLKKIEAKEAEWKAKGAPLKGVKYVSFHPDFIYFADYFGMEELGTLEPKPGIPPSASHTDEIIKLLKAVQGPKVIVREPQYSDSLPNEIAAQTGAKVAKVASMVNGLPEAKTWIEMIDVNLNNILKAVQ